MRALIVVSVFALAACGGSTDTAKPTRYNFGIVDGANQRSTAGKPALEKKITAQLTRDPNGEFATRVFDFLAPAVAYAQGLSLAGEPVANAIVCGREAVAGEPQVQPLCAFTLADGKAANNVVPGTKAGTYNVVFTAQVPATEPVKDSTTVIVEAGAPNANYQGPTSPTMTSPAVVPADAVQDIYGNAIAYAVEGDATVQVAGSTAGDIAARTLTFKAGTGTSPTDGRLRLLDQKGAVVGILNYRIYPASTTPTPSITVWATGMNVTP